MKSAEIGHDDDRCCTEHGAESEVSIGSRLPVPLEDSG